MMTQLVVSLRNDREKAPSLYDDTTTARVLIEAAQGDLK
jgi:hypothetical protein